MYVVGVLIAGLLIGNFVSGQAVRRNPNPGGGGNSCSDSDGGQNIFIKGYVSAPNQGPAADSCQSLSIVNEYYCYSINAWTAANIRCPDGYLCSDGACTLTTTSTTSTSTTSTSTTSTSTTSTTTTIFQCSGIEIYPVDDIQSAINNNPENTTFCLKPGIHRVYYNDYLFLKNNDKFIGEPGTIISGAKPINSWRQETINGKQLWIADGEAPSIALDPDAICRPQVQFPGPCNYLDAVFINNQPLLRVINLDEVSSGKFYIDYDINRIYIADNPTGKIVEVSVGTHGIIPPRTNNNNIVVRGLIIEKFRNPASWGVVLPNGGSNWLIENNEIRYNHGGGLAGHSYSMVRNNYVHHNGDSGLYGGGIGAIFENNEVAFNNIGGFEANWQAGGSKFVESTNLVVRNNYVHDNNGPGLWTDINNINTTYEGNTIVNNAGPGIYHEISYAATIRNNILRGNGFGQGMPYAGILISSSQDIEIYGNNVIDNYYGIFLWDANRSHSPGFLYGPWETRNVSVHDNYIKISSGMVGLQQIGWVDPTTSYTSKNNHFENNKYCLLTTGLPFYWMNAPRTKEEWIAYGHDETGIFSTINC